MMTQVNVEKNTGNDRLAIQQAIEIAQKEEIGTVVIAGGEWNVDDTCLLYDGIRVIIDGAVINYRGENGIVFRNYYSTTSVGGLIEYTQKNIIITGKNGAKIVGGTILLSNITYSVIEGIDFVDVKNFAIILASTLSIKVRNISFKNCTNAIALGVATRDCYFYNLTGEVKKNFFVMGNYLYEQFRRVHLYRVVMNILVRNVDVKADTFAYLYGNCVERIVFNDIKADVRNVAFNVRYGKHVCLSRLKIKGKVINDDVAENAVCFVD